MYSIKSPKLFCIEFFLKFCHSSGDTQSLLSAFVYSDVVSLLSPRACNILFNRLGNSMLVQGKKQLFHKLESNLNQAPLNLLWIIWWTQLKPRFLIRDSCLIDFDLELFQERYRNRYCFTLFLGRIFNTKLYELFAELILFGTVFLKGLFLLLS